jgi:hypothetical protein
MDLKETSCELAQYPMISGVKPSGSFTRTLICYANKDSQETTRQICNDSLCNWMVKGKAIPVRGCGGP